MKPARFISSARRLTKQYCDEMRTRFKDGCLHLQAEVSNSWESYLAGSSFDSSDTTSAFKAMVTMRTRKDFIKHPQRIVDKLLRELSQNGSKTQTIASAIEREELAPFCAELPRFVRDLSGMEVTLPYTVLVRQFSRWLESHFKDASQFSLVDVDDYITNVQRSGYRAIHLNLTCERLPYEVQIKSYLQSAWGGFTHDLVYKPQDTLVPSDSLQRNFRNLADLLSVADSIAQEIFDSYIEDRNAKQRCIRST